MKLVVVVGMLLGVTFAFGQKRTAPVLKTKKVEMVSLADAERKQQILGLVRVKGNNACDTWIQVEENGRSKRFVPANLPERFKVDGMYIRFSHEPVGTKRQAQCVTGKSIMVSDVKATPHRLVK